MMTWLKRLFEPHTGATVAAPLPPDREPIDRTGYYERQVRAQAARAAELQAELDNMLRKGARDAGNR